METSLTYQKNYKLFTEQYPLSPFFTVSKEGRGWSLCQTGVKKQWNLKKRSDETDLYLHSQEDAEIEGRQWLGHLDLSMNRVLVVYGVGLGYYYLAAKAWLAQSPHHKLIFLEDDPSVLHAFFHLDTATELLQDPQVALFFLNPFSHEEGPFKALAEQMIYRRVDFSSLYFYEKHYAHFETHFRYKILFYKQLIEMYFGEYLRGGEHYFRNFYANIAQLSEAYLMKDLYGKFKNVPAIICGAGPSLKKNVHLLKGLENKALIFAGGSAMNAVNASQILPHFGIGVDPFPGQFTRLIMNTAYEVPFIYSNRLHHEALSLVHGPHLFINSDVGYEVTEWFEKKFEIEGPKIETGANVVNFACSIAKWMGCNPIVIIGTDLAYTEGLSYSPGIANHAIHDPKQDMITKSQQEEVLLRQDIYGKPIFTLWKWVTESFWYTLFKAQNPELQIINATEGGLGMETIPNMTFQEVIEQYLTEEYDLAGWLHSEIQKARMPPQVTKDKIWEYTRALEESFQRCSEKVNLFAKRYSKEMGDFTELDKDLEHELSYEVILKSFIDRFREFAKETEKGMPEHLRNEAFKKNNFELQLKFIDQCIKVNLFYINEAKKSALSDKQTPENIAQEAVSIEKLPKDLKNYSVYYGDDGKVLSIVPYNDGKAFFYYADGSLHSILTLKDRKKEGPQKYFYSNGKIKSLIPYKNDVLDGLVKLYYPSGYLKREVQFLNGKRHGIDRIYFQDGNPYIEAFYEQDAPIGIARMWHRNGTLIKEITYGEPGKRSKVRGWDITGKELSEEHLKKEDYFDKVTKQSEKLTEALTDVVGALKDVVEPLDPSHSLTKDLEDLSDEMSKLKSLGKEVLAASGIEEEASGDQLWKNPSVKHELEEHINQMDAKMQGSFIQINAQVSFLKKLLNIIASKEKTDNPDEKDKS